jgi:hypothetical protein
MMRLPALAFAAIYLAASGCGSEDSTSEPDAFDAAADIGDAGADVPTYDWSDGYVELCGCGPAEHCTPPGPCEPDVCKKGKVTCASETERQICTFDGSKVTVVACPDGQRCYGGICNEPVCLPGDPPLCQAGNRLVCNEKGTAYIARDCPEGTECKDGECQ